MAGLTLSEKILSRVVGRTVREGEIISPEPELVTTHDWYVVNFADLLEKLGVDKLYAPEKLVISTDHEPVAPTPITAAKSATKKAPAKKAAPKKAADADEKPAAKKTAAAAKKTTATKTTAKKAPAKKAKSA